MSIYTPSKHFVGSKNPFYQYLCWSGILIALAHILIASANINSTEKMQRL